MVVVNFRDHVFDEIEKLKQQLEKLEIWLRSVRFKWDKWIDFLTGESEIKHIQYYLLAIKKEEIHSDCWLDQIRLSVNKSIEEIYSVIDKKIWEVTNAIVSSKDVEKLIIGEDLVKFRQQIKMIKDTCIDRRVKREYAPNIEKICWQIIMEISKTSTGESLLTGYLVKKEEQKIKPDNVKNNLPKAADQNDQKLIAVKKELLGKIQIIRKQLLSKINNINKKSIKEDIQKIINYLKKDQLQEAKNLLKLIGNILKIDLGLDKIEIIC